MSRTYDTYGEATYPDASNAYEKAYGSEDRHGGNALPCNGCSGRGVQQPLEPVRDNRVVFPELCSWCHGTGFMGPDECKCMVTP